MINMLKKHSSSVFLLFAISAIAINPIAAEGLRGPSGGFLLGKDTENDPADSRELLFDGTPRELLRVAGYHELVPVPDACTTFLDYNPYGYTVRSDCPKGSRCRSDGFCYVSLCSSPDRNCPAPQICERSHCFYECSSTQDCPFDMFCSAHGVCLNEGSLRFTLEWEGVHDDLELYVVTPGDSTFLGVRGGALLGGWRDYDEVSGGIMKRSDKYWNLYFPEVTSGPPGRYVYWVYKCCSRHPTDPVEQWTLKVWDLGRLVAEHTGMGGIFGISYHRNCINVIEGTNGDDILTATDCDDLIIGRAGDDTIVGASENDFILGNGDCDEVEGTMGLFILNSCLTTCGTDQECPTGKFCTQGMCLSEGNPRFTLEWEGGDDFLDLHVTSRSRITLNYRNMLDEKTEGRYEYDHNHGFLTMQNIYFPGKKGGPDGDYVYWVHLAAMNGGSLDEWTLKVWDMGRLVAEHMGTGSAGPFTYSKNCVNLIEGTSGDDFLVGTSCDDIIIGRAGDDTLDGAAGNDYIVGGSGDDVLLGQGGQDVIIGSDGDDSIIGGVGDDFIDAGKGHDTIDGGAGLDTILGGEGNDEAMGGIGDDSIRGGGGADDLKGGNGSDFIDGGDEGDTIDGEVGDDTLHGAAGDDRIFGGDGSDELKGGDGEDSLVGGSGSDTLDGGEGTDTLEGGPGNDESTNGEVTVP